MLFRSDGFVVDNGIHLVRFGPHSAISRVCGHLGHRVRYHAMGPSYVVDHDGAVKTFPTGPLPVLTTRLFTWRERLQAARVLLGTKRQSGRAKGGGGTVWRGT